jgi:hypothetical protein
MTYGLDTSWKQNSNMPISRIDPQAATAEALRIAQSIKGGMDADRRSPTSEPAPFIDLTPRPTPEQPE